MIKKIFSKVLRFLLVCIFFIVLVSCNDTPVDTGFLFEVKERHSGSFILSPSDSNLVVKNPIGFTFLFGVGDSVRE